MERYREIIDNWEKFRKESQEHPISTVRKNRVKAGENFEEELEREFETVEQSGWNPEIYRLPETRKPGKTLLHWLGEYYVQEETASLPVEILEPQKQEKILDLCAAPGGKTTQIASKIENSGTVVANDKSSKRIHSLQSNIYRTGSYCVNTTNHDGRNFPGEEFDRILVDAPCTGEGNRYRRNFKSSEKEERENLSKLQEQLLERAVEIVKDNGTVVYSTCTFAPEENEEVVQKIMEEKNVTLEELDPGIKHLKGVESFQDRNYREEMRKCVRVYPHHVKSGGIFVAKMVKK